MMGRAAQTPGVQQVFSLFETVDAAALSRHRPHQGAAARRQRPRRVRGAADLSRLGLRQRLQPVRPHLPGDRAGERRRTATTPNDVLKIRVRNSSGDTVPLGSFTTVRDISGPYRVPRYNLYPAAELDGDAAPGYQPGAGDRDHGEARRRGAARRLQLSSGRRSRSSSCAPAIRRSSPSRWRSCSCSWCWRRNTRA